MYSHTYDIRRNINYASSIFKLIQNTKSHYFWNMREYDETSFKKTEASNLNTNPRSSLEKVVKGWVAFYIMMNDKIIYFMKNIERNLRQINRFQIFI